MSDAVLVNVDSLPGSMAIFVFSFIIASILVDKAAVSTLNVVLPHAFVDVISIIGPSSEATFLAELIILALVLVWFTWLNHVWVAIVAHCFLDWNSLVEFDRISVNLFLKVEWAKFHPVS